MKKRSHLQTIRYTKGFNQAEFAKLIGISQQYLSRIEAGYVPPDELNERIAQKLGMDFVERKDNVPQINP